MPLLWSDLPERAFLRAGDAHGLDARTLAAGTKRGELHRAARGLYYRGVLYQWGRSIPSVSETLQALYGDRGYGPAGYSAAQWWGVCRQVPNAEYIATHRATEVRGVRYVTRRSSARRHMTPSEIALLELLREGTYMFDDPWEQLVSAVHESVVAGRVRTEVLAAALTREPPTTRTHTLRLLNDLRDTVSH